MSSVVSKDFLNHILEPIGAKFSVLNAYGSKYEPWQLVLGTGAVVYVGCKFHEYWCDLERPLFIHLKSEAFQLVRRIPFVAAKIEAEIGKVRESITSSVVALNQGSRFVTELPAFGKSETEILDMIDDYNKLATNDWKSGKLSGCVYGADDNVRDLVTKVFGKFAFSNPLHSDVFPDVRKMEAEVIRWTLNLFNGDQEACGSLTSGGTESIMLACKANRELGYSKKGIRRPEMVIPVTAHAAFNKAGKYFKIKVRMVPVDPVTFKVNPKTMESYINSNTIMLVGSAPNFPNGAIDPIEELSQLAIKYDLPLHVDACLGGYLIPFMGSVGYNLPLFDFRLPGVTSISCDTHKYGFTPKGTSVVMYKNNKYRRGQFFEAINWTGGIYASPTFAGSRAGSLIALTWATLMSYGMNGYMESTKKIIDTTRYIYNEILKIPNIYVLCKPDVSIIAFDSKDMNILNVYDEMSKKGWHLNAIQNPTGVHIAVTKLHTQEGVAEKFVSDLKECVKMVMESPDKSGGKTAALYCSSQSVPDQSLIVDCAYLFLEACYSTKD